MNLKHLTPLLLAFVMIPLSGCISAEEFYGHMEKEYESWGENSEDAYNDWKEDRKDQSSGSSSGGSQPEEEECPIDMITGSGGSSSEPEEENETDPEEEEEDEHDDFDSDVSQRDIERAFRDAKPRFSNFVDGDENSRRTVSVSLGDDSLRVGLIHHLEGEVTIQLRSPLGFVVAEETFDGHKEMYEDEWFYVEDPTPGDWRLTIHIDGGYGGYALGFYVDE